MNRYMVFSGTNKHPSGGMHDFASDLSDKDVAFALAKKLKNIEKGWAHVYDTEDRKIILEI